MSCINFNKLPQGVSRVNSTKLNHAKHSSPIKPLKLPLDDGNHQVLNRTHTSHPVISESHHIVGRSDALLLKDLNSQLMKVCDQRMNFYLQNKVLAQRNAENEARIRELDKKYKSARENNQRLVNEVFRLQEVQHKNAQELKAKNADFRMVKEENASLHCKYWSLKNNELEMNQKLASLTRELESLRYSSYMLYTQKNSLAEGFEETKAKLKKECAEVHRLRQVAGELQVKDIELTNSKSEIERDLLLSKKLVEGFKKRIPFLESKLCSLEEEKTKLITELVELRKQNESKGNLQMSAAENLNITVAALKNQLEEKIIQVDRLEKELEAKSLELDDLKHRSAIVEQKNLKLEMCIVNLEDQNARLKQVNSDQLASLAEIPELKIKLRTVEMEKIKLSADYETLCKKNAKAIVIGAKQSVKSIITAI